MKRILIVLLMLFQTLALSAETLSLKNKKDVFGDDTKEMYLAASITSQYNDCVFGIEKTGAGKYDSRMFIVDKSSVRFNNFTVIRIKIGDTILDDTFISANIYDKNTLSINMTSDMYKQIIDSMSVDEEVWLKIYIKPLGSNSILIALDNYNFKENYSKLK